MSKVAFIVESRGDDYAPICSLLQEYTKTIGDDREMVVIFNACSEEFVESIAGKFKIISIVNLKNPEFPPVSLNRGLRFARDNGMNASVLSAKESPSVQVEAVNLPLAVLCSIGVLSPNFQISHYWMDYALRAFAGNTSVDIPKEVIEKELASESQWDWLKFGTMWGVPNDTPPEKFWEWATSQKWTWSDEMRVQ